MVGVGNDPLTPMAAVYTAAPSPVIGGVMPGEPPSDSGIVVGSGIQFHWPGVSVPEVTTDPETSCGVPMLDSWFGQSHSAHFTGGLSGRADPPPVALEPGFARDAELHCAQQIAAVAHNSGRAVGRREEAQVVIS